VTGVAAQSLSHLSYAEVPRPPQGTSQLARPILLDHNENAYGPSKKVLAVLREAPSIGNRYPRQEYDILRGKLAALHTVKEEQILLACGSSEILRGAKPAHAQRLAVDQTVGSIQPVRSGGPPMAMSPGVFRLRFESQLERSKFSVEG
jgi:hypothetical protein